MLPTRQPGFARCGVRGRAATRRRGQKGTGHQGFLSPLATPQLSFAPLSVAFAAKNEESVDCRSALSFFFLPQLCAPVICRATAGSRGRRKIRGCRKRGYKKPQVSCIPSCKKPAALRQHPPLLRKKHFYPQLCVKLSG